MADKLNVSMILCKEVEVKDGALLSDCCELTYPRSKPKAIAHKPKNTTKNHFDLFMKNNHAIQI